MFKDQNGPPSREGNANNKEPVPPPVESCAHNQIQRGAWRVTLRNLIFLVLFRCGVSAERLHSWYYSIDSKDAVKVAGRGEKSWETFWQTNEPGKNPGFKEGGGLLSHNPEPTHPNLRGHLTPFRFIL